MVRPSVSKMEHLSNHLSFCSACVNNLDHQLFPERKENIATFSHKPTSKDRKAEVNIQRIVTAITTHALFFADTENKGLWNFLENKQANSEQAHDVLNFKSIGQQAFEGYIQSKLLKQPSTAAPVCRKRLCTFSTTQVEKRRVKMADK